MCTCDHEVTPPSTCAHTHVFSILHFNHDCRNELFSIFLKRKFIESALIECSANDAVSYRTLALYKHGGVWIDTDTIILRDLRPLYEFCGEFATQLSMSMYVTIPIIGPTKSVDDVYVCMTRVFESEIVLEFACFVKHITIHETIYG